MIDKPLSLIGKLSNAEAIEVNGVPFLNAIDVGHLVRQHETEEKVTAAVNADPIPVPSDEEGYFKWLKNPHPKEEKLRAALKRLIDLKAHKDAHGKDDWYERNRKEAWEQAIAALEDAGKADSGPSVPLSPATPESHYIRQMRQAKEDVALLGSVLPHEQIAHARKREARIKELESRLAPVSSGQTLVPTINSGYDAAKAVMEGVRPDADSSPRAAACNGDNVAPSAPEQPDDFACLVDGLSVSRKLLKEWFPEPETHQKVLGMISLLQRNAEEAVEKATKLESGAIDKDVQIDAWRKIANAKARVKWQRGFPTEGGMYLVRLADGEMCVTPWNDGSGKNKDSWGDERKTGWYCLADSRSTVKGWISVADLQTLPCDSIINQIEGQS